MSSGGEPGVASTPNIDVRVARTAALSPESQRVLDSSVWGPDRPAVLEQANRARALLAKDPARPLGTVRSLGELFGKRGAKSTEVVPRAQAEKRDSSIVSRPGDEELALYVGDQTSTEGIRQAQIIVAGEVARRIIETGSLSGRDINNISQQIEALRVLIPEIAGIELDNPQAIVEFANAELRNPEVMQAFIRRYNELQSREVPADPKAVQQVVEKATRAKGEAEARQRAAQFEEARLADRRASLMPEPGRNGPLRDQLAALEARADLTPDNLELARRIQNKARNEWMSKAEAGADPAQVEAAKADFEAKRAAFDQLQKDIVTRDTLAKERDGGLDESIAKNKSTREQADSDVATAAAALKQAEAAHKAIRDNRLSFEAEYASDYTELLAASIAEVNDARAEVINNRLLEEAQKNGTEMDKFMAARVKTAYQRTVPKGFLITEKTGKFGFGRRTKTEEVIPDVFKARGEVMSDLLSENGKGPAQMLRRELMKAYNGNEAEVNKLMADHDFVVKWSTELAFNAINTHLQNRGKLNDGQIRYIESQGELGEAVIAKYRKSHEVVEYEAKLKEEGKLPPGGFDAVLATEEGKKKHLEMIFKIAAGVVGPAVAAVAGSAAQTAHGSGH